MSALALALASLASKLGRVSRDRRSVMPEPPRPEVSESRGDLVTTGPRLTTILAMPLDLFARGDLLLEVRVPWLDVTLWFVPDERDAEALVRDGMSRGQVWTATELMDVMAIGGRTPEALRTIALAKLTFDGVGAVIRRPGG